MNPINWQSVKCKSSTNSNKRRLWSAWRRKRVVAVFAPKAIPFLTPKCFGGVDERSTKNWQQKEEESLRNSIGKYSTSKNPREHDLLGDFTWHVRSFQALAPGKHDCTSLSLSLCFSSTIKWLHMAEYWIYQKLSRICGISATSLRNVSTCFRKSLTEISIADGCK